MIPADVAKRIIVRFERAVARRACAHAAGQSDHAITFEYRQSKRELINLIQLLRTGENPDRSMEDKLPSMPRSQPSQSAGTALSNEPGEPQATR